MQSPQHSELQSTRKNFLINMHTKYRQIKEKPILGIDYDILRYGKRYSKQHQSSQQTFNNSMNSNNNNNNVQQNSSDINQQPKDSLIRNQTSHSFRPSTNHSTLSKNSTFSNRFDSRNPHHVHSSSELPLKVDFDTFKKYQKEFQDFRKQKQRDSMMQQQFLVQSGYMKQSNNNNEQSKNVFTRLQNATMNNHHTNRNIPTMTQSITHKKNSKSHLYSLDTYNNESNPNTNQLNQHNNELDNKNDNNSNNNIQQNNNQENINIQDGQNNNKNSQQYQLHTDPFEQIEKADRKYEQEKEQQQNQEKKENGFNQQQVPTDSNLSENNNNNYSQIQFDPNSTSYQKMINKYIGMNPDYFRHLQGDCICGRCTCGKCKCPYKLLPMELKMGQQSMYQQDFQKFKNFEQLPQITMDFHSQQFRNLDQIKFCSTTQNDFRPNIVKEPVYHKAPISNKTECQFIGSSSYKNNYVDWKHCQAEKIPVPKEQTVVQAIPFVGRTMYMEDFQKKPMKDRDFEEFIKMKNKSKLSPMNPDFKYHNQTNYQFFYQGSTPSKVDIVKPKQQPAKITPSAPDQYKTNFIREYEDKSQINCPSRVELMELSKKEKQRRYQEYLEKEANKNNNPSQPVTMNSIFQQKFNRPLKTHS